jgi:hypothetical protein
VLPDTDEVYPFNVYYGTYDIYQDTVIYGGKVSEIDPSDTRHSGWSHVPYNIPTFGAYSGPGFYWIEFDSSATYIDFDLMYKHMGPAGIVKEGGIPPKDSFTGICINPNPFNKFCNVVLNSAHHQETAILSIYDIQGRLVRKISFENLRNNSMVWDGKDKYGRDANPGIYFLKINGKHTAKATKLN